MATHDIHSAGFAQCVQFIDKDDTGRLCGRLRKKITDTSRTDADEHFYKLRPADAEKSNFGLPGHGFCQKRFAGPGQAHQEYPFGNPPSQFLEFLRVL